MIRQINCILNKKFIKVNNVRLYSNNRLLGKIINNPYVKHMSCELDQYKYQKSWDYLYQNEKLSKIKFSKIKNFNSFKKDESVCIVTGCYAGAIIFFGTLNSIFSAITTHEYYERNILFNIAHDCINIATYSMSLYAFIMALLYSNHCYKIYKYNTIIKMADTDKLKNKNKNKK